MELTALLTVIAIIAILGTLDDFWKAVNGKPNRFANALNALIVIYVLVGVALRNLEVIIWPAPIWIGW